MTETTYKRIAYIEIAIYTIIGIYFIQKFLLKYYIEDIKQNNAEYSKSVGAVFTATIAGTSPLQSFNNLITQRFKSLFNLYSVMYNNIFSSIGNIAGDQINSLNSIRNYTRPIRNYITDATMFFYKTIEQFSITIMYTFHRLRQTVLRSLSSFNLIFHTLENTRNLFLSISNSSLLRYIFNTAGTMQWIGNSIGRLCFDGHMPIQLSDGSTKYIKDIQCGDKLYDGSIVTSTLDFLNNEPLYSIYSKQLNIDVLVSGTHVIYDFKHHVWKTVSSYEHSTKTHYIPTKLYCISTSNHRINIGELLFADYEEISNDYTLTYKLNHYILCGLNYNLSAIENYYFCLGTKHMDSGLHKDTLLLMNNNTTKCIKDIQIGDILSNNITVNGIVKIYSKVHKWYKWNNIICSDATKIYDYKLSIWRLVGSFDDAEIYNINDTNNNDFDNVAIGYQLIISTDKKVLMDQYIEVMDNQSSNVYRVVDFIQISDNKIQNIIEQLGMKHMKK
jgi:hypothetical protein